MPYDRSPIHFIGGTSMAGPNEDPGQTAAAMAAVVSRLTASSAPGKVAAPSAGGTHASIPIPSSAAPPATPVTSLVVRRRDGDSDESPVRGGSARVHPGGSTTAGSGGTAAAAV